MPSHIPSTALSPTDLLMLNGIMASAGFRGTDAALFSIVVWRGLWRNPHLAAHPRRQVLLLIFLSAALGYRTASELR